MTSVCPQCKFPIPREGSRFCNQCGAELNPLSGQTIDQGLGSSRAVEITAKPNDEFIYVSSPHTDVSPNKAMVASQDNKQPQRPGATLHILLRDASMIERDLIKDETKIGKGPHNDIILSDLSVSGSHAMISFTNGDYLIADLGSRNGTLLNDVKITEQRKLHHGDLIKIGHCKITFRLKDAEDTVSVKRTLLLDPNEPPPPPIPPPVPKTPALTEEALVPALVSSGLVAQSEVERLRGAGEKGRTLCRALLEEKLISEIGLRDVISRTFNIPPVDLKIMDVDASAAVVLRYPFLHEKIVCPVVGQASDRLTIATADPTDKATIDEIERITQKKATLRLATPGEIKAKLSSYFTPRLIGVTPSGEKIEALLNQTEIEIGKAPHNRLAIADPTVSSTHAIVIVRDGGYSIVDLGSSNGTFINGARLGNEAHTLQHGDKIQLGQVLLTFRNPAETTENKTARLSLEVLEEIRRRASMNLPMAGVRTDPSAQQMTPAGLVVASPALPGTVENAAEKKEKKKKKKDDRLTAAWVGGISRIVAQVLGVVLTVGLTLYLLNRTPGSGGKISNPDSGSSSNVASTGAKSSLIHSETWKNFSTGFFGGAVEASGVAYAPGTNGVIFVSDNRENEVLWIQLDENGNQVGAIKPVPLGVNFKDPEAITYGNSFFYVVTSQTDPNDGSKNALIRFDFNPETKSLRSQAEIITDFRSFLLANVSEIASLGAPSGMQGGLNIEGIAWDPNYERLLLGLRSPLIGNQAVLIPLKLRDPRGAFTVDNLKVDDPHVIVLSL